MNKQFPPTEARLLDAQAMQVLKEVATEFAVFNSAATGKADSRGNRASILTSVLVDAVDSPQADFTRSDKPQQRADAFAVGSGQRAQHCRNAVRDRDRGRKPIGDPRHCLLCR